MKAKWPKEWPGVVCRECGDVILELTDVKAIPYRIGVNGYNGIEVDEFKAWDVDGGCRHDANNPMPLTPMAEEMLAIAKADSK